jgi:exodeoxyribonuclease-3
VRIATWNVNSIKQRLDAAVAWLAERQPDIVCLQETKCVDDAFPREPFEAAGYNVAVHGQKAFNGVALLSKFPFDEVSSGLPGDHADDHARFIEAVVSTASGALRVASIYLPNGNPPETEKYSYKMAWMKRLSAYARDRLPLEEPLILAGDYNVIPAVADARNPQMWVGDALFLRARAANSVRSSISVSPTRCARQPTSLAFIRSGTIRPVPGRRITASAGSTISGCRRRSATASAILPSHVMRGDGSGRQITCRCGLISPSTQRHSVSREALRS